MVVVLVFDGWLMTSRFILYTSPSTFHVYKECLPSAVHMRIHNTAPPLLFWVALKFSPIQSSVCMEDWKSRPPKPCPRLRHLLGCAERLGFWGASNATACYRSDRRHRLLSGGRSRDCTANIVPHRPWSAASSNALCQLVRMEPPVPWAWVLRWVYFWSYCFYIQ